MGNHEANVERLCGLETGQVRVGGRVTKQHSVYTKEDSLNLERYKLQRYANQL